jgi:hypothetical protein
MKHNMLIGLVGITLASPVMASDSDSEDIFNTDPFFSRSRSTVDRTFQDMQARLDTLGRRMEAFRHSVSGNTSKTTVTFRDGSRTVTMTSEKETSSKLADSLAKYLGSLDIVKDYMKLLQLSESEFPAGSTATEAIKADLPKLVEHIRSVLETLEDFKSGRLAPFVDPHSRAYDSDAHRIIKQIVDKLARLREDYPILFGSHNAGEEDFNIPVELSELIDSACANANIMLSCLNIGNLKEGDDYLGYLNAAIPNIRNHPFVKKLEQGAFRPKSLLDKSMHDAFLKLYRERLESLLDASRRGAAAADALSKENQAKAQKKAAVVDSPRPAAVRADGPMGKDKEEAAQKSTWNVLESIDTLREYLTGAAKGLSDLSAHYILREAEAKERAGPVSEEQIRKEVETDRATRIFIKDLKAVMPKVKEFVEANAKDGYTRTLLMGQYYEIKAALYAFLQNHTKPLNDPAEEHVVTEVKKPEEGMVEVPYAEATLLHSPPAVRAEFEIPSDVHERFVYLDGLLTLCKFGAERDQVESLQALPHYQAEFVSLPYVQAVIEQNQTSRSASITEKERSFQDEIRRVLGELENLFNTPIKAKPVDRSNPFGMDHDNNTPDSYRKRSDSMEGIRVSAVYRNDEGIRVTPSSSLDLSTRGAARETTEEFFAATVPTPKQNLAYKALMGSAGVHFTDFKPERGLLEILGNLIDYTVMLPNLLLSEVAADRALIINCFLNATREKEKLMDHPYRAERFSGKFRTEEGTKARMEELSFREKIDETLAKIEKVIRETDEEINQRAY